MTEKSTRSSARISSQLAKRGDNLGVKKTLLDHFAPSQSNPVLALPYDDDEIQLISEPAQSEPIADQRGPYNEPFNASTEEETDARSTTHRDANPSVMSRRLATIPGTGLKKLHSIFTKSTSTQSSVLPPSLTTAVDADNDEPCGSIAGETQPKSMATSYFHISSDPPPHSRSAGGETGSRSAPITIESSPSRPSPLRPKVMCSGPLPSINPFFAPRNREALDKVANITPSARGSVAPYPRGENQHVRGPQTVYTAPGIVIKRRNEGIDRYRIPGNTPDGALCFHTAEDSGAIHLATGVSKLRSEDCNRSVPPSHMPVPAISRFHDTDPLEQHALASSSQLNWAEKWRPRRAEECIGNDEHALYLRDWLSALALQEEGVSASNDADQSGNQKQGKLSRRTTKRPRVVRSRVKERGRKRLRLDSDDEDESWIANSDEADTPGDVTSDDELLLASASSSPPPSSYAGSESGLDVNAVRDATRRGYIKPQNPANRRPPLFEDGLTNTIVLAGPHGCGKTAAVYACAAELGWEVFEVYPGIGKRSGTNLDNLVGEVGKNHLVNSAKRKVTGLNDALPAKVGGLSLFNGEVSANPAGEDNRPRKKRLRKAGEEVQEVAASITQVEAANVDADRPTSVRQSIILLEEVDILYKEDANFWPSVVELIRNCRRPVVMTCNDPLLIPVDTLPIQTTLRFISCEPALAVSYLQMLCLAEGYCVDRDYILQVYQSAHEVLATDMPDVPLHPDVSPLPSPDLRRSIHHLQFYCAQSSVGDHVHEQSHENGAPADITCTAPQDDSDHDHNIASALSRMQAHTETLSSLDSYLGRRPGDILEANAPDGIPTSSDEEMGHQHLRKPIALSGLQNILPAFYHQDEDMARDVLGRSRASLVDAKTPLEAREAPDTRAIYHARVQYQFEMLVVLGRLLPLHAPLLPRPTVFLDYVPWIRHMVAADDVNEVQPGPGDHLRRHRRSTRNRQRHERWMPFDEGQLRTLRGNALGAEVDGHG